MPENKKYIFPDLEGKEYETLYIIGNGFDLYHGLKSRYSDFRKWLSKKKELKYTEFIKRMEKLFPLYTSQDMLWSNFENALGKYKEWLIYNEYEAENPTLDTYRREQKMLQDVRETCEAIRPFMTEWAKDISLAKVQKKLYLSDESLYVNFNYTRILEEIYDIPQNHVCHFHGSVDENIPVITGHNNLYDFNYTPYDDETDTTHTTMNSMLEEFNTLAKNPKNQINRYNDFFRTISKANIKHVVFIGHSLDTVDYENLKEIYNYVGLNAVSHFNVYQPIDRFSIYNFLQDSQIDINRGSNFILPQDKVSWKEKISRRIFKL